jgi:tetratricopeptide (TPR) repeat protein
MKGEYDKAIGCCDKALQFNPKFAPAWQTKGEALGAKGEYNKAIDCCDKALQYDPKFVYALITKSQALFLQNRYDEASDCCDQILKLDPESALAKKHKGEIQQMKDQHSAATLDKTRPDPESLQIKNTVLRSLQQLFQKKPTHKPARKTLVKNDSQSTLSPSIPYSALIFGKELGRGDFGIVFEGTLQLTEARSIKKVAIKQLPQVDKQSADTLAEFHQETQVIKQLNHSNIIRLYGVCTDQIPYCLAMEYMPRGSLYDVLHKDVPPLTTQTQEKIAIDIACGLAYLHDRKIMHHYLKSSNVLLNDDFHAKLTDFGLAEVRLKARVMSDRSDDDDTIRWMAPEIMVYKPYTSSADIYSYGVILWELVTRKIPFEGQPPAVIVPQVTQGKREAVDPIPESCPPKLSRLIRQCWTKELSERPSANDAINQLKEEVSSSPVTLTAGDSHLSNLDSNQETSVSYKR